jgi:dihydroceramidase
MFLAGFGLWLMDNTFCRHLTTTKNTILLPWSILLEGHGWWHILTGLGTLLPLAFPSSSPIMLMTDVGPQAVRNTHQTVQRQSADSRRHKLLTLTLAGVAYHMILWRVWLVRCLDGSEKEFMLDWVPLRSVPQVVPRPGATAVNGSRQKTKKTQ